MIFSPSAEGENATVLTIIEHLVATLAATNKSLAQRSKSYTGTKRLKAGRRMIGLAWRASANRVHHPAPRRGGEGYRAAPTAIIPQPRLL